MRDLLIILALLCGAFVLEGCPAPMSTAAPPCIHDKPHQCLYADPLSLEWWENEVAFKDAP